MGSSQAQSGDAAVQEAAEDSDESQDSSDEENDLKMTKQEKAMESEDMSDDDSDQAMDGASRAVRGDGVDEFQAPGVMDIPRVDDIPIVSKLAKKTREERMAEMDGEALLEFKK